MTNTAARTVNAHDLKDGDIVRQHGITVRLVDVKHYGDASQPGGLTVGSNAVVISDWRNDSIDSLLRHFLTEDEQADGSTTWRIQGNGFTWWNVIG